MNRCASVVCASTMIFVLNGCRAVDDWRHPEVVACDDYTKASLKSPSSYQRVKTTIATSRLPLSYWQESSKETFSRISSKEFDVLNAELDRQRTTAGGIRTVFIEYDAQNGFGVPVRGLSMCRFEMSSVENGEFSREPSASGAKLAQMTAAIEGKVADDLGCCESKATLARFDKYRSKEQYLSQQVLN